MSSQTKARSRDWSLNALGVVVAVLAAVVALLAVDFSANVLLPILLFILIGTLGAVFAIQARIEARRKAARLAYIAAHGRRTAELVNAHIKHLGGGVNVRQRALLTELSEMFAASMARFSGERIWITVRQVYMDEEDQPRVHDAGHALASVRPNGAPGPVERGDLPVNPAFRAIWSRARQIAHPYYVCNEIEAEWRPSFAQYAASIDQADWYSFLDAMMAYFGRPWPFPYRSILVVPVGGDPTRAVTGEDGIARFMPWGYMALVSDAPRVFDDKGTLDIALKWAATVGQAIDARPAGDTDTEADPKTVPSTDPGAHPGTGMPPEPTT